MKRFLLCYLLCLGMPLFGLSQAQPITPLNLAQTAKGPGQATLALQRCGQSIPMNIIRTLLLKPFPWTPHMMDLISEGALDGLSAAEATRAAELMALGVPQDAATASFGLSDILRWRSCFKEVNPDVLKAWMKTRPIMDMDSYEFNYLWKNPQSYRARGVLPSP